MCAFQQIPQTLELLWLATTIFGYTITQAEAGNLPHPNKHTPQICCIYVCVRTYVNVYFIFMRERKHFTNSMTNQMSNMQQIAQAYQWRVHAVLEQCVEQVEIK